MKDNNNLKKLVVDENISLKKIMSAINQNSYGACFITSNSKFKAVITDGDIRKIILKKHSLNQNISKFIKNKKSVVLNYLSTDLEILKKLSNNIKIIPLINDDRIIVDFSTIEKVKKINIYDTNLKGNELNYVVNCLKTGWISSVGKYVLLFEEKFSKLFKSKYSLSVTSGSTGLHLALKTLGIGHDDEVIMPNLTFAATINAIINVGAKPVLVDVDKNTYNINPNLIKKKISPKTKAVMCVHLYGQPCEMNSILEITRKNKLYLIEDCAEALGSKYKNKFVSSFGDISVFSFFGNKTVTTGEGGMLVTNNKVFFQKAKLLRNHGMDQNKKYWHNVIGFNYRMTNLQAAVGLAQLENIDKIICKKKQIAKKYEQEIKKLPNNIKKIIYMPAKKKIFLNTFWLYNIRIKSLTEKKRNK